MTDPGAAGVEPAAVVGRWFDEVWGRGDLSLIGEIVAPRYVRHGQGGSVVRSPAELERDLEQYFRLFHKPVLTIDDQAVSGDRVWSRVTIEGVDLEAGSPRVMTWVQIHRVDEYGRIAESWLLYAHDVDWRDNTLT